MFCEIGQRSAVIEMEVCEDDQINCLVNGIWCGVKLRKVRIPATVCVEHVDADIEDYCLILQSNADARPTNVLTCP